MSHLWRRDDEAQWVKTPLDGEVYTLVGAPLWVAPRAPRSEETALMRRRQDTDDGLEPQWVLFTPLADTFPRVRVNGLAVTAGLRTLRHRDEIVVPGTGRCFLATQEPAAITTYPGSDAAGAQRCLRCGTPLEPGREAVRCPLCKRWHHSTGESPCWTYAPTCLCGHATRLDRSDAWVPEDD